MNNRFIPPRISDNFPDFNSEEFKTALKEHEASEEFKQEIKDIKKEFNAFKKQRRIQYVKDNLLSFIIIVISIATLVVTILK